MDAGLNVYINNPNINGTSSSTSNPDGIHVNDSNVSVWVNGGVLQNIGGEGVQVEHAKLFHITGTEVINVNNKGIDIEQGESDVRVTNVLVRDSCKTYGMNRAVDLEGLTGSIDVHNVTIQDDQMTPTGNVFFTSDLHLAKGIIDGVSGYIPYGSLYFTFQLDMAGDPETNVLKRNLSSPSSSTSTQPNCNTTTEGLTWYIYGSSSVDSKYQICQYNAGTLAWGPH